METIKALTTKLNLGEYDERLGFVYCKKKSELEYHRDRLNKAFLSYIKIFKANENTEVSVFSAPGRTELGGNHTDHQRGKVLTGSVDLDAIAVVGSNDDGKIHIFSEGYGSIEISADDFEKRQEEENTSISLLRGMVRAVKDRGFEAKGFNAYITSDVPGGSGLSSSACIEVLYGVIMNGLFCDNSLSSCEIAQMGQYAENVYFGKPSGLLDQMGCSIGGIIVIDFKDKEKPDFKSVEYDFAKSGYKLCMVDCGADHADLTADYKAIPEENILIAGYFGKSVLREVDEEKFLSEATVLRERFGDRAVLRAVHFYMDCKRVDEMKSLLEKDDFEGYLNEVALSGNSSFKYLQNISTGRDSRQQPLALTLALAESYLGEGKDKKGVCRVHGGGFAGAVQVYVKDSEIKDFRAFMEDIYASASCRVISIRPVGGTELLW